VKTAPPVISVASGSKTAIAWQGIAGFVFPVGGKFELQADYRYQGIGDTSHNSVFFAPADIGFKNKTTKSSC
jgi:opacity protein-like surface antigen